MGKTKLLTALALSIGLVSLPLLHFGIHAAAVFSIFVGYFVALMEFNRHTRLFQIITLYFNALVFGLALDQFSAGLPYFTAMFLALTLSVTVRVHLHRYILLSRVLWAEPLIFGAAVALYVLANNNASADWLGWAAPASFLGYGVYLIAGRIVSGIQVKRAEQVPYSAGLGTSAPPFLLHDQENNLVNINDYKGRMNILLLFVRGDWCPTCHVMLRVYQKLYRKVRDKNIMVMAISPDNVAVNREMAEKLGLEYKVLSDEIQEVANAYGIQLQDNNPGVTYAEGIPMPAAFLIDRNGLVVYASRHDRIGEILKAADIIPIIDAMPQTA